MSKMLSAALLLAVGVQTQAASFYNCSTSAGCVKTSVDAKSNYAQTRYPLVFAHGAGGFSTIGSIGSWYQIPEDLAANGATVFITKASALNSSEARGEQFRQQVKTIMALTGSPKVNLVGQSHGGPTIRYALATLPENTVASLTTIGSPHKGSPIADILAGASELPGMKLPADVIAAVANAFGGLVNVVSGFDPNLKQDALASLGSLTTKVLLSLPPDSPLACRLQLVVKAHTLLGARSFTLGRVPVGSPVQWIRRIIFRRR